MPADRSHSPGPSASRDDDGVAGTSTGSRKRVKKFTRTRTGCLSCRKSKHKCDEQKPVCARCRTSDKECSWPTTVLNEIGEFVAAASHVATPNFTSNNSLVQPTPLEFPAQGVLHQPHDSHVSSSPRSALSVTPTLVTASNGQDMSVHPFMTPTPEGPALRLKEAQLAEKRSTSEALAICFPNAEERSLMEHFLSHGASLFQAIPIPQVPLLFLQTSQIVASPRGLSIPSDALLFALLSLASVHQSYLETFNPQAEPPTINDPTSATAAAASATTRTRLLSSHLAQTSHALVLSSLALNSSPLTGDSTPPPQCDVMIATAVSLVFSAVLAASTLWSESFALAKQMVRMRGGPRAMLVEEKAKMDRGETAPGALMRCRTMLEALVWIEVFDCMGTGRYPDIMNEPFSPWFFEFSGPASANPVPQAPGAPIPNPFPDDWETVETAVGMSRGMLELINRVNMLVALVRYPQDVPFPASASLPVLDVDSRARNLLLELEIWKGEAGRSLDGIGRVEFGNMIYAYTLQIIIITDILAQPHSHPTVQHSATCGLQLLVKSNVSNGIVVGLMWPAVICGSTSLSLPMRATTRAILAYFREGCCYDTDAAVALLEALWERRDAGEVDPGWRDGWRLGGLLLI